MDKAATRQLKEIKRIWIQGLKEDFAIRSLNMSEESPMQMLKRINSMDKEEENDEADLRYFKLRWTWERRNQKINSEINGPFNCPHPYLFFDMDHIKMTYFCFNIELQIGNLVDAYSETLLEAGIMQRNLQDALNENFDSPPREEKLIKLCSVIGVDVPYDPDPTYELSTDNVKKILDIYMRFRCDIPVIIMGETGCGKTRLVKFMCKLQCPIDEEVQNMVLMKVHGGTRRSNIIRKVEEAQKIAQENITNYRQKLYTMLFFDEANTTEAIGLIKEIMCDHAMEGEPLKLCQSLKIVAACNPYRKHSEDLIKRLEQAGLGYQVDAEKPTDRMGRVPIRRLVYGVQPLPQSMLIQVWGFGQLDTKWEEMYIKQMVLRNDFATRSLNMSEESPKQILKRIDSMDEEEENDDADLRQFQLRRTWKSRYKKINSEISGLFNCPHPYLFLNISRITITFLGFNIKRQTGNLADAQTGTPLEAGFMQKNLQDALKRNKVPINGNFDSLPREEKLSKLCSVMGVDVPYDPDLTYELTTTVRECYMLFRHSVAQIKRFKQEGLGYQVDAEQTTYRIGRVPMRRLMYGVQSLPQSMPPLVWDFGQIDTKVNEIYIKLMVLRHIIRDDGRSDADTNGREMTVERQEIYKNYNCSSYGTKLMISALSFAYIVLPCAGGTDLRKSQLENQDHSQIYQASLKFVSKCPLSSEYMNKTLEKCVDVCGSYIKDGNCTYHCMRDSSKTRLVEFCAKPKILFEFCPEYDPVDQTFQKDTASLCNSTSNHTYYTSSDIYFCNPDNCLQLLESDVRSSATTLMTEATEMNGGDIQEVWPLQIWSLILLLVVGVIVLAIFLACILHKRRHLRARPQKKKRKYNMETVMQKLI